MSEWVYVHTDGGCRGNPGPAGIGVVVEEDSPLGRMVIYERAEFLGPRTNNVAEYEALLAAVNACIANGWDKARFFTDSRLMYEQIRGTWRVKDPRILALRTRIVELLEGFTAWEIIQIPREANVEADRLANQAMDGQISRMVER